MLLMNVGGIGPICICQTLPPNSCSCLKIESFILLNKILVSDCDYICGVDVGDSARVGLGVGDFLGYWLD